MKIVAAEHKSGLLFRPGNQRRRGAAAVEMAVVSPLLMLIAVGIIDVGQFVSIGQMVNNASREAARVSIRGDTVAVSEVNAAVLNYMTSAVGDIPADVIGSSLQVRVLDANGVAVAQDLSLVVPGSELQAEVTFDYQDVRWAPTGYFGASTEVRATTVMRRD